MCVSVGAEKWYDQGDGSAARPASQGRGVAGSGFKKRRHFIVEREKQWTRLFFRAGKTRDADQYQVCCD
jgi:hypothetical protein